MNTLKVFMQKTLVGTLGVDENEVYHFSYDERWKEHGFAISPHLDFSGDYSAANVKKFLENLIPEGEGLEDIISFARIAKSNTYAILHTIGYETAGALVFGEHVEEKEALFREISTKELTDRITHIESRSIVIWDKKVRLSLAGVQAKLPVILKEGKIGLGDGTLSSTHIMKFQTKKHLHIVVNELFCMKLAKHIGLNVAEVDLKRFADYPVLMVERFDRIYADDYVERLHMIDACQMLDLPASYKYEQNFGSSRDVAHVREGVSFKKLFAMTKVCSVPAKAQLELIHWAMFNLIIGNSDAHGKNFSFFVNKKGINTTPFYDMLCVMMYDFDHGLAMAYGDEFNPNKIYAFELRAFCEETGVNYKLVAKILMRLCDAVLGVLEEGVVEADLLLADELLFVKKLEELVGQRAVRFKDVAREMPSISY
jgi:serine/threonine-protein kinase HipA